MKAQPADFSFALPSTIQTVIACINRSNCGIALMLDGAGKLITTITDGDVRRAMLDGKALTDSAEMLLAYKSASYQTPVTALAGTPSHQLLKLMHEHNIRQIPLLDAAGRVQDIITWDELLPSDKLPVQAVIMAGGFGTRLRPLTEEMPKPMLPVGDRPIMEHLINQLRTVGIRRINVTTHYQPEKITDYFGDGQNFGVELNYVAEDRPLGTAGALGLMPLPTDTMLVLNGDILTQVDFRAMLTYHREHQAELTVGVRRYEFKVPYGVIECEGAYVKEVREKPELNFLVNAGIYLLEPSVHQDIPKEKRFDMTDLINSLVAQGRKVASFPIMEYWLDIGQHADYLQAQQDIKLFETNP